MSFWPIPDAMMHNIYEIAPRMFTNRGIKFIILDIDNTIAPYTVSEATERMKAWVQRLKDEGLELYILSNNRGDRPKHFAEMLDLPYEKKAWKPFVKKAKALMMERGYSPNKTAFIGDQIYTDVACAKWCGSYAVLVHPIEFNRWILKFRYWLEFPFRLKYSWKYMK